MNSSQSGELVSDELKREFLYQSIADTQATIRAIDVKIGFIFVILFLPLAALKQMYAVVLGLMCITWWFLVPVAIVTVFWVAAYYLLFKSVASISSPSAHVVDGLPRGYFYDSSLYSLKLIDGFFNFPIRSNDSLDDYVVMIPSDDYGVIRELAFERMKLIYIRDVKIYRSSLCKKLTFLWMLFGVVLWVVFLVGGAGK